MAGQKPSGPATSSPATACTAYARPAPTDPDLCPAAAGAAAARLSPTDPDSLPAAPRLKPSADAWSLVEEGFEPELAGKCESLMCVGSGYLGLRAAHEEDYAFQNRGLFVAGSYDRAMGTEIVELPKLPSPEAMEIRLDGERLDLLRRPPASYRRALDLRTGELCRSFAWTGASGRTWTLRFRRLSSLDRANLLAFRLEILAPPEGGVLLLRCGIDGQASNGGAQHFAEGERRVLDRRLLRYAATAPDSGQEVELLLAAGAVASGGARIAADASVAAAGPGATAATSAAAAGATSAAAGAVAGMASPGSGVASPAPARTRFFAERRRILREDRFELAAGERLAYERIVSVRTSRDPDWAGRPAAPPEPGCYEALLEANRRTWSGFWEAAPRINTDELDDVLSLRVALYHLRIMTPADSGQNSVGAKGLTGEGYRGHVFWDSEIFILPFFQFEFPELARGLLEYRVRRLPAAKARAASLGYSGAMFPWESALSGNEECPDFAGLDLHSGALAPVWSGRKEHHVSADLAWAAARYAQISGDADFLASGGAELILETAWFWRSRAVLDGADGRYHIRDVVGPDEYTEHVDDNAYTNYLAKACVDLALELFEDGTLLTRLSGGLTGAKARLDLDRRLSSLRDFSSALYLPEPRHDGVLPQDASFLSLPEVDVASYRSAERKQLILHAFSREQINKLQILKQADAVMLLFLEPGRFPPAVQEASYRYYESRTVHDSSLSPAIHAAVAARLGMLEEAYARFVEAREVDLGKRPHSSDDGVHAAGFGALWMALVMGFGGLVPGPELVLAPRLPKAWRRLGFPLRFQGRHLDIEVDARGLRVRLLSGEPLDITLYGTRHRLSDSLELMPKEGAL